MSLVHIAVAKKITSSQGKKLHSTQKLVLMLLADYANEDSGLAWPAHSSVARDCGISLPTVKRVIASLEEVGLIEVLQRKDDRGVSQSNHYRMLFGGGVTHEPVGVHERTGGRVTHDPTVGSPVNRGRVTHEPGVGSSMTPKQLFNSNELPGNRKENTNTRAERDAQDLADANEIWQDYPRKDGRLEGIPAIAKALSRVRKTGEADAKAYLRVRVIAYSEQMQREATERKHIKMAQGWFNKARYDDEQLRPKPRVEYVEIDPEQDHRRWMQESGVAANV